METSSKSLLSTFTTKERARLRFVTPKLRQVAIVVACETQHEFFRSSASRCRRSENQPMQQDALIKGLPGLQDAHTQGARDRANGAGASPALAEAARKPKSSNESCDHGSSSIRSACSFLGLASRLGSRLGCPASRQKASTSTASVVALPSSRAYKVQEGTVACDNVTASSRSMEATARPHQRNSWD